MPRETVKMLVTAAAAMLPFLYTAPTGAQEATSAATPTVETPITAPMTTPSALTVTTLPGGIRLVVLREPDSPVVVTDVFFNVNRADEGGRSGINALIARTWGIESEWRGAALTQRDLSRIGSAGTDTSDNWVELWAVSGSQPEQVADGLRTLLTNLVANPRFSPETIASATEAQQQARELEQDTIPLDALNTLRGRVWAASPQGLPLLGTDTNLKKIKSDDVIAYYRKRFRPNRCVICVAGNVDPEQIAQKIKNSLGAADWMTGAPAPPLVLPSPEKVPSGLRDRRLARVAPGSTLMVGFIAPGTLPVKVWNGEAYHEEGGKAEYAALLLLDAALAGGKSSRLFATLRDGFEDDQTPLGYDLRSVMQAGQVQSLLAFYVVGATPVAESRTRLLAALQSVASDKPFTDDEISRARTYLQVRHLRERQRPRDRATGAGQAEVMGLGAAFDLNFDAVIGAITTSDVNRLARRVLSAPPAVVYSSLSETSAPAALAPPVTDAAAKETP